MAKNSWNDYSATAANNSDVGNVNTSETMNPSDVNDAIRELMSHTADVVAGTVALSSINIDGGSVTGITDLAVADGGTGASTLTANGVLFGNGTSAIGVTAVGSSGQVLTSNGSSPPTFQDAATTYTHPNHSGEVTSTGDGATVIASNVVDEDNLKVSNSPTDGYILTARSGNTGGLTWEAPAGGGATDIDGLSDAITNSSGATIGLGTGALANDDGTANNNTALGYNALNDITSGSGNVGVGYGAGQTVTTGQKSVYIGRLAAGNAGTGARNNVCIGNQAGYGTSSTYSVYIGDLAGQDGSGIRNVAVGRYSQYGSGTGAYNTTIGYAAGFPITNGNYNSILGYEAAYSLTTGNQNTFLGGRAGDATTTGSNQIVIGYDSDASSATVSNEITLGNSSIATLRCNQTTISSLSDRRDKTDIEDLPIGLDFIKSLRPVKFRWDRRDGTMSNVKDAGFIAQELDEVQQDFNSEEYMKMVLKTNPEKLEAAPGKLIPVLVKAIQELSQEVERLKEGK